MTGNRKLAHDWFPEPLPDNVVLEGRTWLHSAYAFMHYRSRRGLRVGHDTGLYKGTFFDIGPEGEVWIGSYCTLVNVLVCTNRQIEIRDYTFIAHEVVLADDAWSIPPRDRKQDSTGQIGDRPTDVSILIAENAWIGARAILLGGAHIGEGSIVGAGAVVDFEVPPYSIVAGNPARIVGASTGHRNKDTR